MNGREHRGGHPQGYSAVQVSEVTTRPASEAINLSLIIVLQAGCFECYGHASEIGVKCQRRGI